MAYTSESTVTIESLVGPMMLDCPIPIASQGILWAAIEFCDRTKAWSNAITKSVSAGTQHVALTTTDSGIISSVENVRWDDELLVPVTRQESQDLDYDVPYGFYRPNPETVSLAPAAGTAGTLTLTACLTPVRSATTLPKFLFDMYWDAIEHGALWRLMKVPNRPWTDPNQAVFHKQEFDRLVGSFSIVADKDGTRKHLRTAADF